MTPHGHLQLKLESPGTRMDMWSLKSRHNPGELCSFLSMLSIGLVLLEGMEHLDYSASWVVLRLSGYVLKRTCGTSELLHSS